MKIIECHEEQFVKDFFPMIVDLWYADKHNPENGQVFMYRKI